MRRNHWWLLRKVLGTKLQVVIARIWGLRRFKTRYAFNILWNIFLHISIIALIRHPDHQVVIYRDHASPHTEACIPVGNTSIQTHTQPHTKRGMVAWQHKAGQYLIKTLTNGNRRATRSEKPIANFPGLLLVKSTFII